MAKKKDGEEKTNVMRILDGKKIFYRHYSFQPDAAENGVEVARILREDPRQVFKTLVTVGKSNAHYVFVIPVGAELDLKKAAKAANEKFIEMIKQKDLLPLTGYIHGGCSPIGMKKAFPTFIHKTAEDFSTIIFSAGRVGHQVEIPLTDLQKVVPVRVADLTIVE